MIYLPLLERLSVFGVASQGQLEIEFNAGLKVVRK
jgi:hypothetical protein